MEAGKTIREAVAKVSRLREQQARQDGLRAAVVAVKALQARRFAGTYADLMRTPTYGAATRFFLEELYSDRDFAERDAQFARIAGTIEKFFPAAVVQTAVDLAELHALTEALDHDMGVHWLAGDAAQSDAARYMRAWQAVGRRQDRDNQLRDVLAIGQELARLTRAPGLRTMLRMMRGPAAAAGLGALQQFLESGFDTFGAMARGGHVPAFLRIIREREAALIASLFDDPVVACETGLARTLGQAP